MNAAQKLAKRAEKRERQIGRAWTEAAAAAEMSPKQFAAASVFVYADLSTDAVRVLAYSLNPNPELRETGPRAMFACDRARLVQRWRAGGTAPRTVESEAMATMLQTPPQEGFFWLLCVAGAPGNAFSWSISMIARSAYGTAIERGHISREDAIAIRHLLDEEKSGFSSDYPRDHQGPMTDDERVEMARDGWRIGTKAGGGAN